MKNGLNSLLNDLISSLFNSLVGFKKNPEAIKKRGMWNEYIRLLKGEEIWPSTTKIMANPFKLSTQLTLVKI